MVEVEPWRLLPSRGSISVSAHPSCGVGTWVDGSVDVASIPLSWEPSKISAGSRVNGLAETYVSYVAQAFVLLRCLARILSFQYGNAVCTWPDTRSSPGQGGARTRSARC